MLLQGGVLIEVGAGDGAGVQGPGVALGLLLLLRHLGHVSIRRRLGWNCIFSPPDGLNRGGAGAWGTLMSQAVSQGFNENVSGGE